MRGDIFKPGDLVYHIRQEAHARVVRMRSWEIVLDFIEPMKYSTTPMKGYSADIGLVRHAEPIVKPFYVASPVFLGGNI